MAKAVKRKKTLVERPAHPANQTRLTISDLVILSLLAERPMHGYEVNATLEDRKIREWAPVSRPQIYYSLDKLTKLKLIQSASTIPDLARALVAGADKDFPEATRQPQKTARRAAKSGKSNSRRRADRSRSPVS